jgi:hypothetical protein
LNINKPYKIFVRKLHRKRKLGNIKTRNAEIDFKCGNWISLATDMVHCSMFVNTQEVSGKITVFPDGLND